MNVISHFQVLELLGQGGMGVVYRARDLKLDRDVAIKLLPEATLRDPTARARLVREARTASSLNHPNICTIFEVGEAEEQIFIAMELVRGRVLREIIPASGLPAETVLRYGAQIAAALAHAHEHGVVHRDLKSGNVLVDAEEGRAKVLDFGLARRAWSEDERDELRSTITVTQTGEVAGTPPYLAPEVLLGGSADARSDLWALGVVLYEMSTGSLPFSGRTAFELSAAILHHTPAPLPGRLPSGLRAVIQQCLSKEPGLRFRHAGEVRAALEALQGDATRPADAMPTAAPGPVQEGARLAEAQEALRHRRWPLLVGLVVMALVGLVAWWWLWQRDFFWRNPLVNARTERLTDFEGTETEAAISRDGRFVTFLSDRAGPIDVWAGQIGSGEFANLTHGQVPGLSPSYIRSVGFSGDGSHVWYLDTARPPHFETWLIPTIGGARRLLLDPGMSPAWSPDGSQVVYLRGDLPGDPLFVADRNGNNPRKIFEEKVGGHCHFPTWSADGRFIYFARGVLATQDFDIWRVRSSDRAPARPERITHHNAYVGYLSWLDSRTLAYCVHAPDAASGWLYAIDVEHRIPHRLDASINDQYLTVAVSASRPLRLVATVATPTTNLWTVPVSDRIQTESAVARVSVPNARALAPCFASDYLLFISSRGDRDGLWKLDHGAATELWNGSDGGLVAAPTISPDGREISFSFRSRGRNGLYLMNAAGANVRPLAESLDVEGSASWSPDGKWIAVSAKAGEGAGLFKIPVDGGPPVRVLAAPAYGPDWSPDGKSIFYSEPVQGRATRIKAITPTGTPLPIPSIEGTPFRFVRSRNALIYIKERTDLGGDFYWMDLSSGKERRLTKLKPGFWIQSFDVSPDGKQIMFDRWRANADIVLMEPTQ